MKYQDAFEKILSSVELENKDCKKLVESWIIDLDAIYRDSISASTVSGIRNRQMFNYKIMERVRKMLSELVKEKIVE